MSLRAGVSTSYTDAEIEMVFRSRTMSLRAGVSIDAKLATGEFVLVELCYCRLGLARGKTEAQTAASLEPRVPPAYRRDAHMLLIRHARRICTARRPQCERCILADLCPSVRTAIGGEPEPPSAVAD